MSKIVSSKSENAQEEGGKSFCDLDYQWLMNDYPSVLRWYVPCVKVVGAMGVFGQNWTGYMLRRKDREGGFTLIEVMIAVAIIGIATMIAVPNYSIWYSRHQLKQAAMEITSQLAVSRIMAMTRSSTITTTVAIGSGQLIMTATNASGGAVYNQMTAIPHVSTVAFLSGTDIQFSPLGLRTSAGAGDQVIGITNDRGLQYSVRVTQGGKAIWCPKASCP